MSFDAVQGLFVLLLSVSDPLLCGRILIPGYLLSQPEFSYVEQAKHFHLQNS